MKELSEFDAEWYTHYLNPQVDKIVEECKRQEQMGMLPMRYLDYDKRDYELQQSPDGDVSLKIMIPFKDFSEWQAVARLRVVSDKDPKQHRVVMDAVKQLKNAVFELKSKEY